MAKIHSIKIINFRGIKGFSQSFTSNLVCIIGRGDSGKSTILDAILNVLSPSWNITFHDNDFFNCNTSDPINIEATVTDLPEAFLKENKFGLYIRGLAKATNAISDEIEDDHEKALTIQLIVKKDLEPKWFVINGRQSEPIAISAYDRAKPNAFMISDYIDRHFSWSKGNPLYAILKQENNDDESDENIIVEALREAKVKIDAHSFSQFDVAIDKIKTNALHLGIDISNYCCPR